MSLRKNEAVYAPTSVVERPRVEDAPPVCESDAATRAACTLAGHMPWLPPIPQSLGAGGMVPEREPHRRGLGNMRNPYGERTRYA